MISDTIVKDLYRKIRAGEIEQGKKNYVFALKGGGSYQVEATNEKEAWDMLEALEKKVSSLTNIETPSFHGLTYFEIIAEAQKRGLDHE